jgi:hypothetical protein
MTKKKKILLWFTGVIGLAIALLAGLALIAPRFINKDFVRQAIENTFSEELGGTLTYDRVDLSIFPLPHIVVYNPTFAIPGSISGSLKSLDIYPAVLPLLSGKVQIAKTVLGRPDITILLPGETGRSKKKEPAGGSPLQTVLETASRIIPDILFISQNGQLTLIEDQRKVFVLSDLKTRISFHAAQRSEGLLHNAGPDETFRIAGSAAFTISEGGAFPGAVLLTIDTFEFLPRTLSFSRVRAEVLDSSVTVSGKLDDYLTALRKADLSLSGTIGPDFVQWIRTEAELPPALTVHAPLTVSKARLRWNRNVSTHLEGSATVEGGAAFSVDIAWAPESIFLKDMRLHDGESDAHVSFKRGQQILDLSFSGNLAQRTLKRFFEHESVQFGWIKGDIRAHADYGRPEKSMVEGAVEGEGLVIPYISKIPFIVTRLSLKASGDQIVLDPLALTIGKDDLTAKGSIAISEEGFNLDMDLTSARFDWETLHALLTPDRDKQKENSESTSGRKKLPVQGQLRISLDAMSAGRFTAQELQAMVSLERDRTSIELSKATVCGASLPGTIVIAPDDIQLNFRPSAQNQELGPSLACIAGEDFRFTGTFDVSGHLSMRGTNETLLKSLQGKISFSAKKGRVYRDIVVLRVLSFLTISELIKGSYSKLEKEGLPYDSFTLQAEIQNGEIKLSDAVLKSPVANMTGHGSVDLRDKTMYFRLSVAPFTNVDAVVKNVPLVGNMLGGSLVNIPVRVTGPFNDPDVKVLK